MVDGGDSVVETAGASILGAALVVADQAMSLVAPAEEINEWNVRLVIEK